MSKKLIFVVALCAMLSCQKEIAPTHFESEEALVFTACIDTDSDTKTVVSESGDTRGKVFWTAGDEITIGTNGIVYVAEPDAVNPSVAVFTKKNASDPNPIKNSEGVYEAYYGVSSFNAQTFSETLANLPMDAKSANLSLRFRVNCGVLKLTLAKSGENVKRITVTGMSENGTLDDYTLTCPTARSIDSACDFHIALPPGKYTKIVIVDDEEAECLREKTSGSISILANHVQPIGFSASLNFAVQLWEDGPYWAKMNLGAQTAEESGQYFAWGYTEGCVRSADSWVLASDGTTAKKFNSSGFSDYSKHTYEDAASAILGGTWTLPAQTDFQDLLQNCDIEYNPSDYSVPGILVKGKGGYSSRSIFLPAAGEGYGSSLSDSGSSCRYWSSTQKASGTALRLNADCSGGTGSASVVVKNKYYGCPVRPLRPWQQDIRQLQETATIYGCVSCDGEPLEGVVVSDGYLVTKTDAYGMYYMNSAKKNGMVYISTPSGYTAPCTGIQAQFYQYTTADATQNERHDFVLEDDGDQTNHTMLVFGDEHLSNQTNDRNQFAIFTAEINDYMSDHPSDKIYAMTLGDMAWDRYWYERSYCFSEYLADMNVVTNLTVYHCIGNHDHDMNTDVDGTVSGWDAVDWDCAARYRQDIGPNYYSFNIGQIHYMMIDNVYCKNTTGHAPDDRIYEDAVSSECLAWIKKDLSYVSKDTPIVAAMHCPLYKQTGADYLDNCSALEALFSGYSDVRILTGHTHKMWTATNSNITEHNSGAVCACWWWGGYYNDEPSLNVAQDGALGGYRIMDIKGKTHTSFYKTIGRPDSYQFRTYDRNEIKMTGSASGITNTTYASAFETLVDKYGSYNSESSANYVYINVWDYNSNWNISVKEGSTSLAVTQLTTGDPLFLLAYSAQAYKRSGSASFAPFKTNHIFMVTASSANSTLTITVTDDEGRVYTETMTRPKAFSLDTYK